MAQTHKTTAESSVRRWAKRIGVGILLLILLLLGAAAAVGLLLAGPRYAGPPSDHFDGKRFQNLRRSESEGLTGFLKWQLHSHRGAWVDRSDQPGPRPPPRIGPGAMRVTFVNHATVLLQMDGLNILTDPIWSERASPYSWIGPRRHHAPGLTMADLPAIDVVLISHCHYDHLDLPTLVRLEHDHHPRFFVGLGVGPLLTTAGITPERVRELDWWQSVPLADGTDLVGVPSQHFSNRGLGDGDATLWLGYVLRGPSGVAYVAGDTGAGPHFAEIARRFGPPRLAVIPVGAFRPEWFMGRVHVSPEEAVVAAETMRARTTVGIHFGTFALADDAQDEPPRALEAALAKREPLAPRFWILGFGEGRDVP